MKKQIDWRREIERDPVFTEEGRAFALKVGELLAPFFDESFDPWATKKAIDRITITLAGAQGSRHPAREGKTKMPKECKKPRRPIPYKDYVGWHNEAERRHQAGWSCEQCPECGLWTKWYTPAETRKRKREAARSE